MTLVYFALVLGITVFIHELGHFLFAKKAGIHIYEFSIGMGPKIFKFNRKNDETTYSIRLFPIGGFVQMAGESVQGDEQIPEDKLLYNKTWMERFLTIIAGIMFNFILAIIIFFFIALFKGSPSLKPLINEVSGNALKSGLQKNDLVVKINDDKINNIDRFLLELQINSGEEIALKVKRGQEYKTINIKPIKTDENYTYGFSLESEMNTGFLEAIKYSFLKFASLIEQMLMIIFYLITGQLSLSNLAGPVGIYNIVGESAKSGITNLIFLIGYLSVNVGFINLLPIPAFDGGRLLFLIIEKIKRSPINVKTENIIHGIGFVFLMLLMVLVTFNDIVRIFR